MQTLTLHFYSVPGAPAHNSRQHAADCQDLLDNNVYHCQIKSDVPETFEGCFRFTPPGVQSEGFDLTSDGLGDTLSCDYRAKGNFNAPQFSAAKDFHCVTLGIGSGEDLLGFAFTGKVVGKEAKLKSVQTLNDEGVSFVIECEVDPAAAA